MDARVDVVGVKRVDRRTQDGRSGATALAGGRMARRWTGGSRNFGLGAPRRFLPGWQIHPVTGPLRLSQAREEPERRSARRARHLELRRGARDARVPPVRYAE